MISVFVLLGGVPHLGVCTVADGRQETQIAAVLAVGEGRKLVARAE